MQKKWTENFIDAILKTIKGRIGEEVKIGSLVAQKYGKLMCRAENQTAWISSEAQSARKDQKLKEYPSDQQTTENIQWGQLLVEIRNGQEIENFWRRKKNPSEEVWSCEASTRRDRWAIFWNCEGKWKKSKSYLKLRETDRKAAEANGEVDDGILIGHKKDDRRF